VRYTEVIRSIFYLPSYVAIEKGFFAQEGLKVDLSTAWGSDKAIAQLVGGHVDVALLGPESAVYIQTSPSPDKAKIFASLTATDGRFLVARQPVPDFRWDLLKGRTVLGWRKGTTPQLVDDAVMRKRGLDPDKDLNYLTNVPPPALMGAWQSGVGDFATFFEPDVSRIEQEGRGHAVASIGRELGEVDYTAFMAMESFIGKSPDVIQRWTNAIARAQAWVQQADPKEAAKLVTKYFPQLDVELIASSIERNRRHGIWKKDPLLEAAAIDRMQELMIAGGTMKPEQRIKYESVVAAGFAEKARSAVR
jgi:NitT/TauT family transport system substrate-binding protein